VHWSTAAAEDCVAKFRSRRNKREAIINKLTKENVSEIKSFVNTGRQKEIAKYYGEDSMKQQIKPTINITLKQLQGIEWSGTHKYIEREGLGGNHMGISDNGCPACGNWKPHGHKRTCWIDAKLKEYHNGRIQ